MFALNGYLSTLSWAGRESLIYRDDRFASTGVMLKRIIILSLGLGTFASAGIFAMDERGNTGICLMKDKAGKISCIATTANFCTGTGDKWILGDTDCSAYGGAEAPKRGESYATKQCREECHKKCGGTKSAGEYQATWSGNGMCLRSCLSVCN